MEIMQEQQRQKKLEEQTQKRQQALRNIMNADINKLEATEIPKQT